MSETDAAFKSRLDLGACRVGSLRMEQVATANAGHDRTGGFGDRNGIGRIARDEWPGTPEWHARRDQGRVAVAAATEVPSDSPPMDELSE